MRIDKLTTKFQEALADAAAEPRALGLAPRAAARPAAPAGASRDNPAMGIGLIVGSTIFFATGDVAAKMLTGRR